MNRIRNRLDEWRKLALKGEGGVTRTTMELLNYWRREGREMRLFFAQLEAAETIIFLNEARSDFLQGIDVPPDEPTPQQQAEGATAFQAICHQNGDRYRKNNGHGHAGSLVHSKQDQ